MTLNDFPKLTIASIGDQDAEAVWSDPKWIGERHIVCIVMDSDTFVWGRLTNVNARNSSCAFTPDDPHDLAKLEIGRSYPQGDGYWGERAELVLNHSLVWRAREFHASDAVWFEHSRTMCPLSGEIPAGGVLVKGGWDHEHCEICSEKISQQTSPVGVFAEPGHWICDDCYQRFVLSRSLAFIVDEPAKPWWKFWQRR